MDLKAITWNEMKLLLWLSLEVIACYCKDSTLDGANYNDYFSSEELKSEIWKLIHQHNDAYNSFVSKVDQERKLEEIYATVKSTYRGHDLLVQDVLIRRLATLKFGDSCFWPKQDVVDFRGIENASLNQIYRTDQIVAYQKAILQTSHPICDYRMNLRCSPRNKCECKSGRKNEAQVGFIKFDRCELLAGQDCGPDYDDGTYYYDAIENFYSWTKSKSPECSTNSTCRREQFFFHSKCWCQRGKACNNVNGMLEKEVQLIIERNQVVSTNFVINMDQRCDPNFQQELLNPSWGERRRTADRLERLHTLSDYDVPFCNLKLYLNCTEETKQCDCLKPLTFEKGQCRIKNKIPCSESFSKEIKFYPNGLSVQETGKMLQMRFEPKCIEAAKCSKSSKGLHQCTCMDESKAGAFCNETKSTMMTTFLENDRAWPFPKDDAHTQLVHEFNRNFRIFEERLTLSYDTLCYTKNSKYFLRLMRFLLLQSSARTVSNSMRDFQRALSWLKILTDSEILFCNGLKGLQCLSVSRRCRCLNGFHWDADSSQCRINTGRNCDFRILASLFHFQCSRSAVCDLGTQTCICEKGLRGHQCDQEISTVKPKIWGKAVGNDVLLGQSKGRHLSPNSEDQNNQTTQTKLRWFEKLVPMQGDMGGSSGKNSSPEFHFQVNSNDLPIELDQDCPRTNPRCNKHSSVARSSKSSSSWLSPPSQSRSRNPIQDFDNLNTSILSTMTLPLDAPCDPSYDKADYVARYYDPQFYAQQDLEEFLPLIKLHFENSNKQDMPRCNGFEYLGCDPDTRTCKCNVTFDLLPQGGKCYIKTYDLCGDGKTLGIVVGKKRDPPRCRPEDVCDRIRFSLHRCRPLLNAEVFNVSGQQHFILLPLVLFLFCFQLIFLVCIP